MNQYPDNWKAIAVSIKEAAGWCCVRCDHVHDHPSWHVLTVHHIDGDKANCKWWNLAALCQRCHLSIQARVDPGMPYFLEHSDWFKPYAAGLYAWKYLSEDLTRTQVDERMDELLALERLV